MRSLLSGDHVTIKHPPAERSDLLDREGTVTLTAGAIAFVRLEGETADTLCDVAWLARRLDIAQEVADAAPEIAAMNAAIGKAKAALRARFEQDSGKSAIELLEDILPELVALVGLTGLLPAQAAPLVESIARKLAQHGGP